MPAMIPRIDSQLAKQPVPRVFCANAPACWGGGEAPLVLSVTVPEEGTQDRNKAKILSPLVLILRRSSTSTCTILTIPMPSEKTIRKIIEV